MYRVRFCFFLSLLLQHIVYCRHNPSFHSRLALKQSIREVCFIDLTLFVNLSPTSALAKIIYDKDTLSKLETKLSVVSGECLVSHFFSLRSTVDVMGARPTRYDRSYRLC
jgi:hypothetical protein